MDCVKKCWIGGLLLLAMTLWGSGTYQIEISGLDNLIKLDNVNADSNVKIQDISNRKNGYMWRFTPKNPNTISNWKTVEFNFTPNRTGEITLALKAVNFDKTNSCAGYDEIKIFGGDIYNGNFEQTTGYGFAHWVSVNENIAYDEAGNGKCYAIATAKAPVMQYIKVKKMLPVKVIIRTKSLSTSQKFPAKFTFDYRNYHRKANNHFLFINSVIKLLPLDDRGLYTANIKPFYSGITPPERKQPEFTSVNGKNLDEVQIPVELLEDSNVTQNSLVRFGIPLAAGKFFSTHNWQIKDNNGKRIPAQFHALAFWPDKSIKSLLVNFQANLRPREKTIYQIKATTKNLPALPTPLKFTETPQEIQVDTGVLQAQIDKSQLSLLNEVQMGNNYLGRFSTKGFIIRDSDGREFEAKVGDQVRTEIEESGPVSLTIRRQGYLSRWNTPVVGYIVRIRFYANSPVVTFDMEFTNIATDWEFTDLTSLETYFYPAGGITQLNNSKKSSNTIFQHHDRKLEKNGEITAKRWNGFATINGNNINFAIGLLEPWQRYPKSVATDRQRIIFGILPKLPGSDFGNDLPEYLRYSFCEGKYRLKQGTGFRQTLKIDFSGKLSEKQLIAKKIVARLPYEYIISTKVFPTYDNSAKIEQFSSDNARQLLFDRQRLRCYGFMNYGDDVDETTFVWNNGCGDVDYKMFMLFLRTGERKWFRAAMETVRHRTIADTINAFADPGLIGIQWPSAPMHTGHPIRQKNAVPWSYPHTGILDQQTGIVELGGGIVAWLLAGDSEVWNSALLTGNQLLHYSVPGFKHLGPNERYGITLLNSLLSMHYATGDSRYYKAAEYVLTVILAKKQVPLNVKGTISRCY